MRNGQLELIAAKATIFATGGAGRMYLKTTNGYASTAEWMELPSERVCRSWIWISCTFSTTTLKENGVLMTEGARGEGAYCSTPMANIHVQVRPEQGELASRDVVSRAK